MDNAEKNEMYAKVRFVNNNIPALTPKKRNCLKKEESSLFLFLWSHEVRIEGNRNSCGKTGI